MIDLYTLADALLVHVQTVFATAGVALPARAYVADGEVAFDCEQLVVQVGELAMGAPDTPAETRLRLPRWMHVTLSVWLLRCAPTQNDNGDAPTVAQMTTSAHTVLTDRRLCWIATMSRDWQDACQDAAGGTGQSVGPEGGLVGCVTTVRVQV